MQNEKRVYETPEVTKAEFDASDRVVASGCTDANTEKKALDKSDSMPRKHFPDSIDKIIEGKACKRINSTLRGSEILIFEDYVLKITSRDRADGLEGFLSCASPRTIEYFYRRL